ncbi:MAG TPA: hypothetical protein VJI69_05190 [Bacteroidia bacterium]|nr:hypothetical protein [Bacteroidia bacterium]
MKLSTQNIKSILAILVLSIAITTSTNAQCTTVAKEGIKKLAPFTHNGKLNTVTLILDEPSQIHLSVYRGLN